MQLICVIPHKIPDNRTKIAIVAQDDVLYLRLYLSEQGRKIKQQMICCLEINNGRPAAYLTHWRLIGEKGQ